MGPASGSVAAWGTDWWNAGRIAIEEINEANACSGYTIEGILGDSQGDAGQGVSAANDLIARGIFALVGPIFSSVTLPVSELLEDYEIPSFSGSSGLAVTNRGLNYTYRMAFPETESGPFDARSARSITGAQTVVVIHDNTAFAKGLGEVFEEAWVALGGQVLATETITPGEADYSSTLTRVRGLNPDLIYYSGYYPEGAALLRQGRELGLEKDQSGNGWWFGNSNQAPEFVEIAGAASEGALLGTWASPDNDPNMAAYAEKYESMWGQRPSSLGHWAYDAVYLICAAIEASGGVADVDAMDAVLKSGDFEVTGLSGRISYEANGDRQFPPLEIIEVRNGKFTVRSS